MVIRVLGLLQYYADCHPFSALIEKRHITVIFKWNTSNLKTFLFKSNKYTYLKIKLKKKHVVCAVRVKNEAKALNTDFNPRVFFKKRGRFV